MNTKSMKKRLDDLERGSTSHGMIIVFSLGDETDEEAILREIAEGKFTEEDRANRPIIVFDEILARL
jgi:hypothetical protein